MVTTLFMLGFSGGLWMRFGMLIWIHVMEEHSSPLVPHGPLSCPFFLDRFTRRPFESVTV